MKNKIYQIIAICVLILLFIAVVITSVIISNKKKDTEDIPDIESISYIDYNSL